MIQLRDYQQRAVEMLRAACRDRPICVLPTGAGKTVVASFILARTKLPALFVVHRRELVFQAYRRLLDHGVEAGVILSGHEPDPSKRVQVASIQTLARRARPDAGLVFLDEAHHATSNTWRKLVSDYSNAILIGLTATPFRLSGESLGDIFGRIVCPVTVRELCDQGVLVEPTVYGPPGPNMTGVRRVGGEYDEAESVKRMAVLTGDIIEHWKRHALGRKTVAFAVNVAHSNMIANAFRDAGVPATHIDGSSSNAQRDAALNALASGEIHVLCNCMILGEGWDLPALEVAILARPTTSLCLHMQQVGRIMRCAEGKDGALVLDHAGNHHAHGFVTDHIDYSLVTKVRTKAERPTKSCPNCYAIISTFESVCPQCGYTYPVSANATADRVIPDTVEGELVKMTAVSREDKQRAYAELVSAANARNYRIGWARVQYRDRFKVWPRGMKHIEDAYVCRRHEIEQRPYGRVCARCLKTESDLRGGNPQRDPLRDRITA